MDGYLKATTATTIWVGPYHSTNGLTIKSGLKVSAGAFQIAKNGAAYANKTQTSILTLTAPGGWYATKLSSADTNTVGILYYKSRISSYPPVWGSFVILPKTIYSAWFGAGYTPANVMQIEGVDATNQLSAGAGAAKNVIAAAVKTSLATGTGFTAIPWNSAWSAKVASSMFAATTGLSYGGATATSPVKQTADNAGGSALTEGGIAAAVKSLGVNYAASVGLVKKASANVVSASILATGAFTSAKFAAGALSATILAANTKRSIAAITKASIGTGATFTAIPWNAAWDAQVQSEVSDAFVAFDPPTKSELDAAQIAVKVAANGLSAGAVKAGTFSNSKFAGAFISAGNLAAAAKSSIGTAVWATTARTITGLPANAISAPVIATGAITNAKVAAAAFSAAHFKSTAIPGQVAPPAAAALPTQVSYLYKFMRNKVVVDSTAGTVSVYADNGSTVDHVASVTDVGGSFTRTEFGAGS